MAALTPAQARRLDLNAEDLGVPVAALMANAGKALADAVTPHVRPGEVVLLLCGKGNNGGDGFAAAAELQERDVGAWVVLAEDPSKVASAAARSHLDRLDPASVTVWSGPQRAWTDVPVLVDCLLGTGVSGSPRPHYDAIVRWLNQRRAAGATVVSADVPSGLGSRLAVRPTQTVTFHARKAGMTPANSGKVTVADIGIPPAAQADVGLGDLDLAYRRPAHDAHKGDNGVVLVVAGSVPLAGAPFYVAAGAYRTGSDLVHVATPAGAAPAIRAWGPEAIVHAVCGGDALTPEAVPAIAKLMAKCGAVVVGPGLGAGKATREAARQVLALAAKRGLPTVVDADALDAVDAALLRRHGRRMVLTPHAREFQDLAGKAATKANVEAYARKHKVTVLRKSHVDVVADGARTRECRRGHPTLTVGGTGDVLAGITAALLAKGAPPFEAACAASYLLKCAGEDAAATWSYGASAVDVAECVPGVLLRLP